MCKYWWFCLSNWIIDYFYIVSVFSKFSVINEFFIFKNAILEIDNCQKILGNTGKKARETDDTQKW